MCSLIFCSVLSEHYLWCSWQPLEGDIIFVLLMRHQCSKVATPNDGGRIWIQACLLREPASFYCTILRISSELARRCHIYVFFLLFVLHIPSGLNSFIHTVAIWVRHQHSCRYTKFSGFRRRCQFYMLSIQKKFPGTGKLRDGTGSQLLLGYLFCIVQLCAFVTA